MRRVPTMICGIAIGAVLSLTIAATQPTRSQTAEEVVTITKAEWAALAAKNASDAVKNFAEECTMFVPDFPNRLDGKTQIFNLFEAGTNDSSTSLLAEMANEKVQVYGDVAILSYNYMGMDKDATGTVEPTRAKSTRVYVKKGRQWLLVHANFAPAEAPTG